MGIQAVGAFLLAGLVCFGTTAADESASSLLSKGRQAYKEGHYDNAERYHRLAVSVAEHSGNPDQFAEALGELGGILETTGQYVESKSLSLKALGILRSTPTKRYLPVVLNRLGMLASREGDNQQSEKYLKESLRVTQDFEAHDPYIAIVLNNLGVVYYSNGDIGRAEKTFKKANAFIDKELGPDRAELAPTLNNLGGVYLARKKWDAAGAQFYRALSLLENSGNFIDTASVLVSVGTMYHARDNAPEAEKAFRRAYEIRLKVFGAKHPKVARTALDLAATLTLEGTYDEAERLYADALHIYEMALGPSAPEVGSTLMQMAKLLRKTNREDAASKLEARAEFIRFELEHVVRVEQLRAIRSER